MYDRRLLTQVQLWCKRSAVKPLGFICTGNRISIETRVQGGTHRVYAVRARRDRLTKQAGLTIYHELAFVPRLLQRQFREDWCLHGAELAVMQSAESAA